MYSILETKRQNFKVYELYDRHTNSWIKVAPERGGIIFSFGIEGEEVLYLNEETFYDLEKNVRGGIPILFPIAGQLVNGTYEWEGITYSMSNHGFARNASWEVIDTDRTNRVAITIKLTSNEETKISYPFDFEVIFTYALENGNLTIFQQYINNGENQMPIYAGFHPYFKTSIKNLNYETDATKYFDYNDHLVKNFIGNIDLTDKKESIVLLDITQPSISIQFPNLNRKVVISYSEPFKYIVLWTEQNKEFICVEPWMAKTDEFNRKEELVMIESHQSLKTEFIISLK